MLSALGPTYVSVPPLSDNEPMPDAATVKPSDARAAGDTCLNLPEAESY